MRDSVCQNFRVDINGKIGRIDFREREALEEYEEATTRKKKKVVEKKINNLDTWLSFMENVRAMNLLHENGPGSFACKLEIKLDREINGVEESSETQEIDVFHHHDSCHCPCQVHYYAHGFVNNPDPVVSLCSHAVREVIQCSEQRDGARYIRGNARTDGSGIRASAIESVTTFRR